MGYLILYEIEIKHAGNKVDVAVRIYQAHASPRDDFYIDAEAELPWFLQIPVLGTDVQKSFARFIQKAQIVVKLQDTSIHTHEQVKICAPAQLRETFTYQVDATALAFKSYSA